MKKDCIFCKAANEGRKGKSWTVYEDKYCRAILDIGAISKGHTLILPKRHYVNIYDIPNALLSHMMIVAKKLAKSYRISLKATGASIFQMSGEDAQQDIFHYHLHVVPRYKNDDSDFHVKYHPEMKADFDKILNQIKKVKI